MISFKLGGTSVRVHFSFLVFNALVFMFRDSRTVLAFYTVCAIHEAGHLFAMELTGSRAISADFTAAGIRIETRRTGAEPLSRSLAVLIAGPAANTAVYILLGLTGCGGLFAMLNAAAAVYNMLPFRSLDGGAILSLFTVGSPHERTADHILTAVRVIIIAATAAAFIYYHELTVYN